MENVGKGSPSSGLRTTNVTEGNERTKVSGFRIFQNVRKDLMTSESSSEAASPKTVNRSYSDEVNKTGEKDSNEITCEVGRDETSKLQNGPKIITWARGSGRKKQLRSEEVYKNVSNGGINYLEARLLNIAENGGGVITIKSGTSAENTQDKRKTPKIEVRQEDNKTVVKILIKENPTEEETVERNDRFKVIEPDENVYENGYRDPNSVYENCDTGLVYENSNVFAEDERCYENMSTGCYENVDTREDTGAGGLFYENVKVSAGYRNRGSKKELTTDANYGNLNGDDSECNQVYKNVGFQILKNNVVSIFGKNSTPLAQKPSEREEKDDELYENVKNDCPIYVNENLHGNGEKTAAKGNETAEKIESKRRARAETDGKSSVVEQTCHKSTAKVKVEKSETEFVLDDNYSCDQFDSGTCSDVESLPAFVQTRKGNVVVMIKSLQNDDKTEDSKKSDSGHGRAESLTSSGLGVDSEVSDDEKSNISCDSLNSSEPYAQSNSEDHGYHTPNSDDKTGSPIDRIEFQNVMKAKGLELKINQNKGTVNFEADDYCSDKTDIIQQVANASQKIRNLRVENDGVYLAKLVQETELCDYENVRVSGNKTCYYKKKPAPPLPPSKPFDRLFKDTVSNTEDEGAVGMEEEEGKVSLPKNLLQDIRSRSVRLSSTYPSGEKVEGVNNSVANVISNFESNISGERKLNASKKDPLIDLKRLMVDERTYEERKKEVKSVKINKICAMEVDTDKFYKFHLSEKVGNNANGGNEKENEEETFAGIKDYLSREKPAAITSAKGTIRGVKNRVKAGIATFLQLHENKPYKDKDAGKVVVYTTTMGIVRETYHKCLKVKQILRTLMVKFEERDVFMSAEAQNEIRERMKCNVIMVPQVFVEGQHIGDAETIERLNEIGELRTILKPYKSPDACSTCIVCGGYRLLPCSVCKGSKKSIHRNHFTAEFISLKCMNCDQVGLTRCHAC